MLVPPGFVYCLVAPVSSIVLSEAGVHADSSASRSCVGHALGRLLMLVTEIRNTGQRGVVHFFGTEVFTHVVSYRGSAQHNIDACCHSERLLTWRHSLGGRCLGSNVERIGQGEGVPLHYMELSVNGAANTKIVSSPLIVV